MSTFSALRRPGSDDGLRNGGGTQTLQSLQAAYKSPPETTHGSRGVPTLPTAALVLACVSLGIFLGLSVQTVRIRLPAVPSARRLSSQLGGTTGSALHAFPLHSRPPELEFVSYTSSPLEQFFLEKLPEMNFPDHEQHEGGLTQYCTFVAQYQEEIRTWLTQVKHAKSTGDMYFSDDASKQVFSVFEFRYPCHEERGYCTYKTMIEPLAFFLRHPAALCLRSYPDKFWTTSNKSGMMDQGYLLMATRQQTSFGPDEHSHVDLGAMVRGGQPHYIIKKYEQQGVVFDRMLLWEAKQVGGQEIFETVPERWYHAYQFFDIPVTTNVTSPAHPLQVLKRVHPGSGFVAFKLDIDHNQIENKVAETLIEWHDQFPSIQAGQFEFFFEQHVDFAPMRKFWGSSATKSRKTLADSYELFLQMRRLGIRAHGWI